MLNKIRLSLTGLLLVLGSIPLTACVSAVPSATQDKIAELTQSLEQLQARYSSEKIQNEQIADQAIADSGKLKRQVETWYVQTQAACYADFFVNNCLYKAKLIRRDHLIALQKMNAEANAFLRQQHARVLDKDDKKPE